MEKSEVDPLLDAALHKVGDFLIGFAKLTNRDGMMDAEPAGSGTLVKIGSVHGVLTAAHVLTNLPEEGEVGIVLFPTVQPTLQKQTIDMGLAEKVQMGVPPWGPEGPDLGFLRLPPKNVGTLGATNVFFNLEKRRDAVLADATPSPSYFDGISGVVAERTTDLPPKLKETRLKGFNALYGVGLVVEKHDANGFDLLDFEVTYGPGSQSPESYSGMSGGALWRVYCTKDSSGEDSVLETIVFGVVFHESPKSDEMRIITCHGPKSVYGSLIDTVCKRWSSES
jgi:hypothetical protein